MSKIRHLDFMIREDEDLRIKFRFYPRSSHMHSFDENPPKTFKEVYKVYYAWCIMVSHKYSWEEEWDPYERVFNMYCDECSALEYLRYSIQEVIAGAKDTDTVMTMGQPGSDWELSYRRGSSWPDYETGDIHHDPEKDRLHVNVWNNWTECGYRFSMSVDKAKGFVKYLDDINQYMLEHGEPI